MKAVVWEAVRVTLKNSVKEQYSVKDWRYMELMLQTVKELLGHGQKPVCNLMNIKECYYE